jgi:hypothetical protein
MVILFLAIWLPKDWEPSHILYAAGIELLFDALLIALFIGAMMAG